MPKPQMLGGGMSINSFDSLKKTHELSKRHREWLRACFEAHKEVSFKTFMMQ